MTLYVGVGRILVRSLMPHSRREKVRYGTVLSTRRSHLSPKKKSRVGLKNILFVIFSPMCQRVSGEKVPYHTVPHATDLRLSVLIQPKRPWLRAHHQNARLQRTTPSAAVWPDSELWTPHHSNFSRCPNLSYNTLNSGHLPIS